MIEYIPHLALSGGVILNSLALWQLNRRVKGLESLDRHTAQEQSCKRWHTTDQALLDGAFLNYLDEMVRWSEGDEQANPGDVRQLRRLRDAAIRVERYKESHNRKWKPVYDVFLVEPGGSNDARDYFTKEHLATLESPHDNDGV